MRVFVDDVCAPPLFPVSFDTACIHYRRTGPGKSNRFNLSNIPPTTLKRPVGGWRSTLYYRNLRDVMLSPLPSPVVVVLVAIVGFIRAIYAICYNTCEYAHYGAPHLNQHTNTASAARRHIACRPFILMAIFLGHACWLPDRKKPPPLSSSSSSSRSR